MLLTLGSAGADDAVGVEEDNEEEVELVSAAEE